ncbi:type II toxin-antitoxin system RelE/ParE family toxin [Silvibacterium dinghuense]|uniref:Type II toxin-antitoxin system RelE/ParE family toxin n=1 Tax=Silvibacterium dinghuense TaxID=1560006 RepID=A0A4Q1SHT8_9BACT|nr:type II toxin-antitoxin system RelE/ParE family toxin [Silvibacterium dinghuense]RXS97158.1 type II toxin-antitoxin system RelE/ParE family toxin [Silvibacterium dinghuense]
MPRQPLAVYKSRPFARFQRKARISDADLLQAAKAAEQGLIDADLGGGVIKQRIARAGEGKSGGSRSIIFFRRGDRLVYVYGFEKKDRANIRLDELDAFRELARVVLGYTEAEIAQRVRDGALLQVGPSGEEGNA